MVPELNRNWEAILFQVPANSKATGLFERFHIHNPLKLARKGLRRLGKTL